MRAKIRIRKVYPDIIIHVADIIIEGGTSEVVERLIRIIKREVESWGKEYKVI